MRKPRVPRQPASPETPKARTVLPPPRLADLQFGVGRCLQRIHPDIHTDIVVCRQVLEVGLTQGIQPTRSSASGHSSELAQRAVLGIALVQRTGLNEIHEDRPQFLNRMIGSRSHETPHSFQCDAPPLQHERAVACVTENGLSTTGSMASPNDTLSLPQESQAKQRRLRPRISRMSRILPFPSV